MKKALLLYFAFFALGHLLSGCCNCPSVGVPYRFRWTGIILNSYRYVADSGVLSTFPDSSGDFTGKNYMLSVKPQFALLVHNMRRRTSFANTAYACSCAEQEYNPEQAIVSLRVFTATDYDVTHPAGSEVTAYFRSANYSGGLSELQLNIPQTSYSYGVYEEYRLFLATKPTTGTSHQFRVELRLANDSVLSVQTPVLKL